LSYPVFQVPAGDVLPVPFNTYAGSTGASVTLTGLAVTDIEIYKDGSVTQRASDAGYTLLDTDGIDFDGITGIHGFSIDTGDNTDAGFYTVGAWFTVVVSAVTVDTQTVNFIACQFRLMPAEGVAGMPKVDLAAMRGVEQSATDLTDFADAGYDPATNKVQGVVLTDTMTTYTGNTPQTGDSYAVVTNVTYGNSAIETLVDGVETALATAQADLNILTGADGVTLATAQPSITFQPITITAGDAINNITLAGSGSSDGIAFTRSGAGNPFDANFAAQIQSECNDAIVAYDPPTGAELVTEINSVQTDIAAISTTIGVAGAGLTALATQTSVNTIDDFLDTEIAAILADTDAMTTTGVTVATGGIASTSFAAGAIDASAIAADAIGSSELAQSAAQEIADEVLNRDLVGGASVSSRNVRNALRALRNRAAISAGTLTVYQEDDATGAWTAAVTTTAGDPISQIDPA